MALEEDSAEELGEAEATSITTVATWSRPLIQSKID